MATKLRLPYAPYPQHHRLRMVPVERGMQGRVMGGGELGGGGRGDLRGVRKLKRTPDCLT